MQTIAIAYTPTDTKITYDNIRQEIYKVDMTAELITAHYELVNGKVISAEKYTYTNNLLTKTERAGKTCLNLYSYEKFDSNIQIETIENVTYNSFKEPVYTTTYKSNNPNNDTKHH